MVEAETRSRIVVDTNVLISNLDLLKSLVKMSEEFKHVVVIPQEVTRELDGLKVSPKAGLATNARMATNFLFETLANSLPGIEAQRNDEKLDKSLIKDDAILDCCLYFQRAGYTIVLLSNDRNLCVKALSEKVPTVTYQPGLKANEIAARIAYEANVEIYSPDVEMMDVDDDSTLQSEQISVSHLARPDLSANNDISVMSSRASWKGSHTLSAPLSASVQISQAVPIKPSQFTTMSTKKLPLPRKLRYSKYKLIATLENDVYQTLVENARTLSIYRMRREWSDEEYAYLVQEEPQPTAQSLAQTFTRHSLPIFSSFLSRDILDDFKSNEYPTRLTTPTSLQKFVLFWGRVCLGLAENDKTYEDMYNNIVKVYTEFYAPPSQSCAEPMQF